MSEQMELFKIDSTPTVPVLVDRVLADLGDSISPYRIAVLGQEVFDILQFKYLFRPQMAYNYSRNGLIVRGSKRTGAGVTYNKIEVREFLTRFVTRTINR